MSSGGRPIWMILFGLSALLNVLLCMGVVGMAVSPEPGTSRIAAETSDKKVAELEEKAKRRDQEVQKLTRQLDEANARVAASSGTERTPRRPANRPPPVQQPDFVPANVSFKHDEFTSGLRAIGEIANRSGKSYDLASFAITVYGENGEVLDVGYINVTNFAAGQTRTFEVNFLEPSARRMKRYRIQFESGF